MGRDIEQQRFEEGLAHVKAVAHTPPGQPLPPPTWFADVSRADATAAESAIRPASTSKNFGKVMTIGPYTAAEARVDVNERAVSRDEPEATAQPEIEVEDYEI